MKFVPGSEVDSDHCRALTHEYLKCDDAFKLFKYYGEMMITNGRTSELSYRTYNAYSSFLHHLYEFMTGCLARENGNTDITNKGREERTKMLDDYITFHTQRIFNSYRDAIKRGSAPEWVNQLSYYDITIPAEFSKEFRIYRNKISGHVTHERISKLSLSEFYQKYHKFLFYLFLDAKNMWGKSTEDLPDLKEITDFSVMLKYENT